MAGRFAEQFAGDKVEFSADEIVAFFRLYSSLVPSLEATMRPTRAALFVRSLYALDPTRDRSRHGPALARQPSCNRFNL